MKKWNNFELATGLKEKPNNVRLATFLSIVGDDGLQKYESFTFESENERNDLDIVIEKFNISC